MTHRALQPPPYRAGGGVRVRRPQRPVWATATGPQVIAPPPWCAGHRSGDSSAPPGRTPACSRSSSDRPGLRMEAGRVGERTAPPECTKTAASSLLLGLAIYLARSRRQGRTTPSAFAVLTCAGGPVLPCLRSLRPDGAAREGQGGEWASDGQSGGRVIASRRGEKPMRIS